MAYSIKNDSYTCDFCNFEMGWEQKDDVHGEMWGARNAETIFVPNASLTATEKRVYEDDAEF